MLTSGHLLPIIQQYVHLTLPGPSYFTHFHPPAPPPLPTSLHLKILYLIENNSYNLNFYIILLKIVLACMILEGVRINPFNPPCLPPLMGVNPSTTCLIIYQCQISSFNPLLLLHVPPTTHFYLTQCLLLRLRGGG